MLMLITGIQLCTVSNMEVVGDEGTKTKYPT